MAKGLSTHSLFNVRFNLPSTGVTGRGKSVKAMDCSLATDLGLSHLLEPRRLSRAPALVGWLLSYVKKKVIKKGQWSEDKHSLFV